MHASRARRLHMSINASPLIDARVAAAHCDGRQRHRQESGASARFSNRKQLITTRTFIHRPLRPMSIYMQISSARVRACVGSRPHKSKLVVDFVARRRSRLCSSHTAAAATIFVTIGVSDVCTQALSPGLANKTKGIPSPKRGARALQVGTRSLRKQSRDAVKDTRARTARKVVKIH